MENNNNNRDFVIKVIYKENYEPDSYRLEIRKEIYEQKFFDVIIQFVKFLENCGYAPSLTEKTICALEDLNDEVNKECWVSKYDEKE